MNDPTRAVARMLGRDSRLPAGVRGTSRLLVRAMHASKCRCGHNSLLPGLHAADCPYLAIWRAAMAAAEEIEKGGEP